MQQVLDDDQDEEKQNNDENQGKFDFIRDPASHPLLFILPFSKIISDGKGEVVGIITSVSLLEMYN